MTINQEENDSNRVRIVYNDDSQCRCHSWIGNHSYKEMTKIISDDNKRYKDFIRKLQKMQDTGIDEFEDADKGKKKKSKKGKKG